MARGTCTVKKGDPMSDKRQIIPVLGLFATFAMALYMVVRLSAQAGGPIGDFTNAAVAEVHDAQGQVILRGQFALADQEDEDIERKAKLEPTGIDADASGEAEVEFSKTAAAKQEIEFSVRNVQPNGELRLLIDGQSVGSATADGRGRLDAEFDVRMPRASPSR
jgi:hypothetical protein